MRLPISPSLDAPGATVFLAVLLLMFTLPCGWGFLVSCRAIAARVRGQPRWVSPANPPETWGAAVLELAMFIFCGLGALYGLALLWACLTMPR